MTIIRTDHNSSSASVTYATYDDARKAITQMSFKNWDEYKIQASPTYTRTSVDNNNQNYQLKAQWYMTESEGNARVTFNTLQQAKQGYQLFTDRCHFRCQFDMNPINPRVICSWPLQAHHGHAIVNFPTVEVAQEVSFTILLLLKMIF